MNKPLSILVITSFVILGSCGDKNKDVSFKDDVMPVLQAECANCHTEKGQGAQASGFTVNDYQGVITGTKYGHVVIPGDAESSSLYRLVSGEVHASIAMPKKSGAMEDEKIELIKNWINQGAKNN